MVIKNCPHLTTDHRLLFNQESDYSSDENAQFMATSADKHDKSDSAVAASKFPSRQYIDPFAPNTLRQQMTANRRRWVHALPQGLSPLSSA